MNGRFEREQLHGVRKIDRIVYKISKYVSFISGAAVVVVMLMGVINVVGSKLFGWGLPSSTEWITYLNILIVYPALFYVQMDRGHTNVELFQMPPWLEKTIRVLGFLVGAAVMGFLTWRGYVLVLQKYAAHETASTNAFQPLNFQVWKFGAVYVLGNAMVTFGFLWSIVREFCGISIFGAKGRENQMAQNDSIKSDETEGGNA